jgi:hypothetical protein
MMGGEEVRRSLTASWGLFLNRTDAMKLFDLTVDGFWRSFGAVVLVVPIFVVGALADRQRIASEATEALTTSVSHDLFERLVALGIDWLALPILLFFAARSLRIERTYTAFIVARNWSAVIAAVPFGVISLLYLFGFLSTELMALLGLAALAIVLRYSFIVARTALGVGIGFAAGLVAFDFFLSLLILEGIGYLFGATPAP